jgi:hypothetical protein
MQKQEPDYNFALPHRNPLRCPVGALAIQLHFMFDQEGLISRVEDWDWSRPSTWRKVGAHCISVQRMAAYILFQVMLMFGKTVDTKCTPDALRKMYDKFLDHTTIKSQKKLHLARRTMPAIMEDMGCVFVLLQEHIYT